jgi:outer membrane protease
MRSSLLVALAVLSVAPGPGRAQEATTGPGWTVELSPRLAYLRGHTTYRIEASDGASSVASELEFPIETGAIGLHARFAPARDPGRGGPSFEIGGALSIGEATGTMKDSDWLSGAAETAEVGAPHDGRDIYSESKSDVRARMLEARAAWELDAIAPGVVLAPMVGVLYERFEFDVHDGRQWGYGPWNTPEYTGSFAGRALRYEVRYLAPYLGGRAGLERGAFRASAELWWSPVADADDEDDHLLRGKLSTTEARGSAWSAAARAGLRVGGRDTIQAQASVVDVRAEGTQRQRFYAGPDAGLQLRIPSTLTSARTTFLVSYTHAL